MFETELKFVLHNRDEVLARMDRSAEFQRQRASEQTDRYFSPSHRSFIDAAPITEWFRVRDQESSQSICYKNWGSGNSFSCEELETEVGDTSTICLILKRLDFKEIVTVRKERIEWSNGITKVALDRVQGLGDFIEVEQQTTIQNDPMADAEMRATLERIGAKLGGQERGGYPVLLLKTL